jgi:hypothetical protein
MEKEFYRPENIEFNVTIDGSEMPEILGEFEDADEAIKFIGVNFTAINSGITVARHMDAREKQEMRKEYSEIMENSVPVYEKQLSDAETNLTNAKKLQKSAEEAYNFIISEAKSLANEVKRGLKDMVLDEKYTYRIAFKGRFYFFTYIDKKLKLCYIRDISESEKTEIWSQMAGNENFIEKTFNKKKTKK